MIYPVKNAIITNKFGNRILNIEGKKVKSFHYGIDLIGDNFDVVAPCDIIVNEILLPDFKNPAQYKYKEGQWIKLNLPTNAAWTPFLKVTCLNNPFIEFIFKHLNYTNDSGVNAIIREGEKIGEYGQYGFCFGAHLHLEILKNFTNINPEEIFIDNGVKL